MYGTVHGQSVPGKHGVNHMAKSSLAVYRVKWAAERYATQIRSKFPKVKTTVRNLGFDAWCVLVKTPEGTTAWAGPRPKHYGK